MKSQPTILIIDNSPGWTGAIKSILTVTKNIQADFVFAIPKRSQLVQYFTDNHIQFIELPFLEIRKHWSVIFYLPMLLYNAIAIIRFCNKNNIQIIHVNDLYNVTGTVVKIIKPSVKLVQHIRLLPGSYISFFYRIWIKLASRFADTIITVSQISKSSITRYTKRQAEVIYDAVSAPENSINNQPKSNLSFFYPANYTKGKGQDFALLAFAEVVKQKQNVSLTFAGGDLGQSKNIAFKEQLKNDVSLLKLDNYVTIEGFEPNIFEALKRHDVVLNFSESESFSMVCLEALLAGKVLIATDSGGPRELFENGKSGFLINHDLASMKSAMLRVSSDPELRAKMGAEGRRFSSLKFDPLVTAKQLEQVYFEQVTKR